MTLILKSNNSFSSLDDKEKNKTEGEEIGVSMSTA